MGIKIEGQYITFRDHAEKPYEIQIYSAHDKSYVEHKSSYNINNNKPI